MEGCPHFPRPEGPPCLETTRLVEVAKLNKQSFKHCPHPGPSIGALDDGYIHPPRGPSVSWTSNTPYLPLTQLGSGEGLLSPALGFQLALGREDAPGWLVMGYMHSPILGHLLRFYHTRSTARSQELQAQAVAASALTVLAVHRHVCTFAAEDPTCCEGIVSPLPPPCAILLITDPPLSPTITSSGMDLRKKLFPSGACRQLRQRRPRSLFFLFLVMISGCNPWCCEWDLFPIKIFSWLLVFIKT